MQIFPFGTKVVLTFEGVPKKEESSVLYIPNSQEAEDKAIVVAIGSEIRYAKVGTMVVFKPHTADRFEFEGKQYLCVEELDIIGVYGQENE